MKNRIKRVILFLSIFIVLTAPCFGAELKYLKDNQISVAFSEEWVVADEGSVSPEIAQRMSWNEDELVDYLEHPSNVFMAIKNIDQNDIYLDLLYDTQTYDYDAEVKEKYTDNELLAFHQSDGKDFLDYMFLDIKSVGKASIFKGKNENFIKLPVVTDSSEFGTSNFLVYYTIKNDTIICFKLEPLVGKLTKLQTSDGEAVISSFIDKGYYDIYQSEEDLGILIFIASCAGIAIFIAVVIILIRKFVVKARKKKKIGEIFVQQDYHFDNDWGDEPSSSTGEPPQEEAEWQNPPKSSKAKKLKGRKIDI